jgi:predicted DNA-binding transcriptional regulator YafY
MNRVDRLFGMVTLLQARKYASAEQLAAQFGISVRTVYRDIKALGEQGVPVSFEPQRGYCLVPGYLLPPVSFTPLEAQALLLLQTVAASLADASIEAAYSTAFQKVQAVLREPAKNQLVQLTGRFKMYVPEYARGAGDYLATLQTAMADHHQVELDYLNKSGQPSQRRVEPIGLAFYNLAWHVIGWCHLRGEYRDFRLSRIHQLTATTRPFQRTSHWTLTDYISRLQLPHKV